MFYSYDILNFRDGKFAILWLAATGNLKGLKRRDKYFRSIMSVNIVRSCKDILRYTLNQGIDTETGNPKHFSLYLSSMLMFGTIKVHHSQVNILLDEALTSLKTIHSNMFDAPLTAASRITTRLIMSPVESLELEQQQLDVALRPPLLELDALEDADQIYPLTTPRKRGLYCAKDADTFRTPEELSTSEELTRAAAGTELMNVTAGEEYFATLFLEWGDMEETFSKRSLARLEDITIREDLRPPVSIHVPGEMMPVEELEFGPAFTDVPLLDALSSDVPASVLSATAQEDPIHFPIPAISGDHELQQDEAQNSCIVDMRSKQAEQPVRSSEILAEQTEITLPLTAAVSSEVAILETPRLPVTRAHNGIPRKSKSLFVESQVTPVLAEAPPPHRLHIAGEYAADLPPEDERMLLEPVLGPTRAAVAVRGRRGRALRATRRHLVDEVHYIQRRLFTEQLRDTTDTLRVQEARQDCYNIVAGTMTATAQALLTDPNQAYYFHHGAYEARSRYEFTVPHYHLVHGLLPRRLLASTLVNCLTRHYVASDQFEYFDFGNIPARLGQKCELEVKRVEELGVDETGPTEWSTLLSRTGDTSSSLSRTGLRTPDVTLIEKELPSASVKNLSALQTSKAGAPLLVPIPEEAIVIESAPTHVTSTNGAVAPVQRTRDRVASFQEEQFQSMQIDISGISVLPLDVSGEQQLMPPPTSVPSEYYVEVSDTGRRLIKRRTRMSPREGLAVTIESADVHHPPPPHRLLTPPPLQSEPIRNVGSPEFRKDEGPKPKRARTEALKETSVPVVDTPMSEVILPDLPRLLETAVPIERPTTVLSKVFQGFITPIKIASETPGHVLSNLPQPALNNLESTVLRRDKAFGVRQTVQVSQEENFIVPYVEPSDSLSLPPPLRTDSPSMSLSQNLDLVMVHVTVELIERNVPSCRHEDIPGLGLMRRKPFDLSTTDDSEAVVEDGPSLKEPSLKFSDLLPSNPRRSHAARLFSSLLQLHKDEVVVLGQAANYEEIYVYPTYSSC